MPRHADAFSEDSERTAERDSEHWLRKDRRRLKPGDKVYSPLTNQPGVKLAGHVYGLNHYFNDNSKSVAVHAKIDAHRLLKPAALRLSPTLRRNVRKRQIATGSFSRIALPSKAIVSTDGKQFVFALEWLNLNEATWAYSSDGAIPR